MQSRDDNELTLFYRVSSSASLFIDTFCLLLFLTKHIHKTCDVLTKEDKQDDDDDVGRDHEHIPFCRTSTISKESFCSMHCLLLGGALRAAK